MKNEIITQSGTKQWERLSESIKSHPIMTKHADQVRHVFGLSDFVATQFSAHPQWLYALLDEPRVSISQRCQSVRETVASATNEDELMRLLRLARNRHMAEIAWYDLINGQSIEASLIEVSELADTLILSAYDWLYGHFCNTIGVPEGEFGPQPMLILAMGKLGGKELNFSSDIDLIFSYPTKGEVIGKRRNLEHQQFFTKLAQKLINTLNKVTADGQVFRVDMRLRPFGDSGPLVAHFGALEDYYQDQGRQWERYAMVKARILNPHSSYSEQLRSILHPFIYRRYIDFTTLDAIREMKMLIAKELRRRRLDNNIKLGAGGIREVEFFAQSFQLIHGGREPRLQEKGLLPILEALSALDFVPDEDIQQLRDDYYFLRKTEHTLQQIGDQQTQLLPDDAWSQAVLTQVMQFDSYDEFLTNLEAVMARIHAQFNQLVEEGVTQSDEHDDLLSRCSDAWQIGLSLEEFIPLVSPELSHDAAAEVYAQLVDFRTSLRHSLLGQRGEDTLNKLIPEVLFYLLCECPEDVCRVLSRLLTVINAITGRTTYLDLLHENTHVLKQLITLCARSEWITQQIRSFPLLLDELLTPVYLQQQVTGLKESIDEYATELRQQLLRVEPDDIELMMEQWRQFKLCQQLRIAASDISGSLPVAKVSDKLTALAEVLLGAVVHSAWQQITQRYGTPEHLTGDNLGLVVIAYGKLGGYELGYGSDLDLVFLHDAPQHTQTTGKKVISAQQFYIKLTQRIMHLLNTKTHSGQLFEADLRLRPSGNAGLLCCSMTGFVHYQEHEAWTWEHQALVRARPVFGDASLTAEFATIRNQILRKKRDIPALIHDVTSMREKMREHLLEAKESRVDLKQCAGGITDIEFMSQFCVLAQSSQYPELTRWTDNLRIIECAKEVGLISQERGDAVQQAYLQLRDRYHQLTLSGEKLSQNNAELDEIRQRVTTLWHKVFATTQPE